MRLGQQDDGYDNGYYRVARHADGGISPGTLSLFPDVLDLTAIHPYRYFTDSVMLLMVEAFVTVSHLMLDIRWHEIVLVGVVVVLPSAGLHLFVGSPGGAAAPAFLFCLAAMVGSMRSFPYGWTPLAVSQRN